MSREGETLVMLERDRDTHPSHGRKTPWHGKVGVARGPAPPDAGLVQHHRMLGSATIERSELQYLIATEVGCPRTAGCGAPIDAALVARWEQEMVSGVEYRGEE